MLLAVPETVFMTALRLVVFKSGSFSWAISSSCLWERVATISVPVAEAPFLSFNFCLMSSETGGSLVMKVKVRSSKMVISAGIIWPRLSLVLSLYWLQKSMMLTPCWPRAGPTGGAGLAAPAGRFNLRTVLIFLAKASFQEEIRNPNF